MPLDRTHQHISSDIMRVDAVHSPIASVQVAGPFTIAFDTPGLINPDKGIGLLAVPAGAFVLTAFPVATDESWTNGVDTYLELGLGDPLTGGGLADLAAYSLLSGNGTYWIDQDNSPTPYVNPQLAWADGLYLMAAVFDSGLGLTGGTADIYIVILTPDI